MKKKILVFILLLMLLPKFSYAIENDEIDYAWIEEAVETATNTQELNILSKCAVIFDRSSKKIIFGKNENMKVPMASTTKIMTAIILVENANLSEKIEVCEEAAMVQGSSIDLKKGDKITYNDLLYGLMLESGNDAATQIAISVAGSVENFAQLMNSKAKELGVINTHFVTPHGLDDDDHYTTASELAIISDYALSIPKIAEVVSTKNYVITINGYQKGLSNTNELLGYLTGVNGLKTGFTNGAGRCLVTSVKRADFEIITVVLGADTKKIRTRDSINLVEYAYKNYELTNLKEKIENEFKTWKSLNSGQIHIEKTNENDLEIELGEYKYEKYPVRKENADKIDIDTFTNSLYLEAPLEKGYVFANIIVRDNGETIMDIPIKLAKTIPRKTIFNYFKEIVGMGLRKSSITQKLHNIELEPKKRESVD